MKLVFKEVFAVEFVLLDSVLFGFVVFVLLVYVWFCYVLFEVELVVFFVGVVSFLVVLAITVPFLSIVTVSLSLLYDKSPLVMFVWISHVKLVFTGVLFYVELVVLVGVVVFLVELFVEFY